MIEKLGKYKILGEIGQGAMGKVYRAHDPMLNRQVAIKTISAQGNAEDLRKRFEREAQAAAALNHPNIITVHDFGEEQGTIYIAMELLEGSDLKDVIAAGAEMTIEQKIEILEECADALAYAHEKGIVHRDLKPSNIWTLPSGHVKVLDFGLARLGKADLTRDGAVLGTPNYMSPEQVLGDKVDARSDVFSLGAVFYELVCGKKPFDAETVPAVLFQVVHKEPTRVSEWIPVPEIVVEVLDKALAKDRSKRFQSATELREALRYVRHALETGATDAKLSSASADTQEQPPGAPRVPRPTAPPKDGSGSQPPAGVRRPGSSGAPSGAVPRPSRSTPPAARSRPPIARRPAEPSRAPLFAGLALAIVALGAGAFWWMRRPAPAASAPPSPAANEQVGALKEALVATQVELVKRDLDDKDYARAISQAESVLKLDPGNAEVQRMIATAKEALAAIDAAAAGAQKAFEAGDLDAASAALSQLLALDPKHPVATDLASRLNARFRNQADEARRLAAQSRVAAEKDGAASQPSFVQAAGTEREAQARLAKGDFAEATRGFLEARDAFDRGRRAAVPPARPPQVAAALPAATPAAAPASLAPAPSAAPTAAAPATTLPAPAPETLPRATPPPAPARPFSIGRTSVASTGKKVTGFDTADVVNPDFACRIEFEVSPRAVRPGESYSVGAYLANDSQKPMKVKAAVISAKQNGSPAPAPPVRDTREVPPQQKVLLAQIGGAFADSVANWELEVLVTSPKGDTCRNRLGWK